jgi:hypothetical protein
VTKLLTTYKGIAHAKVGSGDSILFWSDSWNGNVLEHTFPHLFSFANNKKATLKEVMDTEALQDNFQIPLSGEALEQFCEL